MPAPTLGEDWRFALRSLEPGWDSYRGLPISEKAIDSLAGFSVVPCSAGGIQLEIHQDGYDIEICIDPKGEIESVLISHEQAL
jgi:hypothetical protein